MESRLSSSDEVEEDGEPRSLQAEMACGLLSHGREHQSYSEMSPAVRPNTIYFAIFIVNWDAVSIKWVIWCKLTGQTRPTVGFKSLFTSSLGLCVLTHSLFFFF